MPEIMIHTVLARPVDLQRGVEMGRMRLVAMVEGIGAEYRLYFDIQNEFFLIVMWPTAGGRKEIEDWMRAEQELAYLPVAAGPGGYMRSWFLSLRTVVDSATDDILHSEFVGTIAPQN